MKHPPPPSITYTKEQLEEMLRKMQDASNMFYRCATQAGNHPFIEFTGFMNEYIKLCKEAMDSDVDFTQCSAHSGQQLIPMQTYHANYLGEKFGCIFYTSFAENPELVAAFCREAFGVEITIK